MANDDEIETLVVHVGYHFVQAGFAGDDSPRAVFPTIVGRKRHRGVMVGMGQRDFYVGDEAMSYRGILTLSRVINPSNMTINSMDDYERLLHHTFYNELRVAPQEHPVLLTESPMLPPEQRSKIVQILFETFNVPALYLANESALALLASGRTHGLVVDLGDCHGHVVPFLESTLSSITQDPSTPNGDSTLPEMAGPPVRVSAGAGELLSRELNFRLSELGYDFTTTVEKEIVRDIKEKLCRVSVEDSSQASPAGAGDQARDYDLPDGTVIHLDAPSLSVSDVLFDSSLLRQKIETGDEPLWAPKAESMDLVDAIMTAAAPFEHEAPKQSLLFNVVLSGGNTMFPNLSERLSKDLRERRLETHGQIKGTDTKVIAPPERKYSTWIGGSILGSLSFFESLWISKEQYDEIGPEIINQKYPGGHQRFSSHGSLVKAARS